MAVNNLVESDCKVLNNTSGLKYATKQLKQKKAQANLSERLVPAQKSIKDVKFSYEKLTIHKYSSLKT
ncbi:MAG: hypothetical protein ACJAWV_003840 [Flammeovirgaceae bacterium]|jgi:hypothetical protein